MKIFSKNFKDKKQVAKSAVLSLLSSGAILYLSSTSYAQDNDYTPLIGRIPAEFRSNPISVNSFEVTPIVDAEAEFVDNLFVSSAVPVNDTILSIRPKVFIRDRREDRQLGLRLSAGYETFLENSVNDRFTFDANGTAKFGLGTLTRTSFGLNFRQNDTQGFAVTDNPSLSGQPLSLTSYGGRMGIERDLGQLTAFLEGAYKATEYTGDVFVGGDVFDSSFRDFDSLKAIGRLSYAISPDQRIYTQVVYNKVEYGDLSEGINLPNFLLTDRSSDDVSFLIGYRRQLTNLLRLNVNAGYITQDFVDPSFSNQDSFVFNADLLWEPTRLTTVQLSGNRSVDTSNDPFFNGFLRTTGSLTVSHELRRNIVLDANVRYSVLDIQRGGENGNQFGTYAALRYFLSKDWSVKARVEYLDQDTIFFPGTQTRLTLGIRHNF